MLVRDADSACLRGADCVRQGWVDWMYVGTLCTNLKLLSKENLFTKGADSSPTEQDLTPPLVTWEQCVSHQETGDLSGWDEKTPNGPGIPDS